MTIAPRIFGILTLAYGAYTAGRPASLLKAADLPDKYRPLATAVGVRDIASGAWLASGLAPDSALATRIANDLLDVAVFGSICPPQAKAKAMGIAGSWAAIGGALMLLARRA